MTHSLFDLHCDTAFRMLKESQPLWNNQFSVSLQSAEKFKHYTQVMALWTDDHLDDESGWSQMLSMRQHLINDVAILKGCAKISVRYTDTEVPQLFLSVEDARILAGQIKRVDELYSLGIRILTPLWKGETCIGGSHDTALGLTPFGVSALRRAAELGMILDISHASKASANEIFEIASNHSRPVIASHSNAYDVCPVSRNLTREQISNLIFTNGLIGLNLHVPFLTTTGSATVADLFPHIEYFLEQGAADILCLGCDMDGCTLPPDLSEVGALFHLAELLQKHNYPEQLIQQIFFKNAVGFAKKYLQ